VKRGTNPDAFERSSDKWEAPDRTKDGTGSPEGEQAQRTRGLDPATVKQFLGMLQRRDRLGPDYGTRW